MNPKVREDFPMLARQLDGQPIVYLDSAATALKPRSVLEAESLYSTHFTANVHRGKHSLSEEASWAYESARRRVAQFVQSSPEGVVFVRNTTEAINLVAQGLGLPRDATVLISRNEHHSNLLPWMARMRVHLFAADPCLPLPVPQLVEAMERLRPRVLAVAHASNVTGVLNPVADLCRAARALGVTTVVDAAQSAPHIPIDMEALGCDFLAFSGHKLVGPTGIGILCGRPERLEALTPPLLGGGVVELVSESGFTLRRSPHRFEAGTPHISGALGLAAAMDYLDKIGFEALAEHERALAGAMLEAVQDLPGVEPLMAKEPSLGLVTLAVTNPLLHGDTLATMLSDSYKMMTRSGYHCAHLLFDDRHFTRGSVRASAYLYNTVAEVRQFGVAIRELLGRLTRR